MANSKIFDSWTWNRRLPPPFDDVSVSIKSNAYLSKYNTEATKTASLHAATLSAILQRMELHLVPEDENSGAVGTQGSALYTVEYPSKTGELHTVVFNRQTGKFIAGRYDDITQPPRPYILKENEQSGNIFLFCKNTLLFKITHRIHIRTIETYTKMKMISGRCSCCSYRCNLISFGYTLSRFYIQCRCMHINSN